MTLAEFRQLKKFLMLAAENDSDAEAIAAFRRATDLLRKSGHTWEQAMDRVVTVVNEVIDAGAPGVDDESALFEAALSNAREGSFRDTLLDIYEKHRSGMRLSERQWKVVRDAAERDAGRHSGGRVR